VLTADTGRPVKQRPRHGVQRGRSGRTAATDGGRHHDRPAAAVTVSASKNGFVDAIRAAAAAPARHAGAIADLGRGEHRPPPDARRRRHRRVLDEDGETHARARDPALLA
jgi:hypothetical protein